MSLEPIKPDDKTSLFFFVYIFRERSPTEEGSDYKIHTERVIVSFPPEWIIKFYFCYSYCISLSHQNTILSIRTIYNSEYI